LVAFVKLNPFSHDGPHRGDSGSRSDQMRAQPFLAIPQGQRDRFAIIERLVFSHGISVRDVRMRPCADSPSNRVGKTPLGDRAISEDI
jgi:hypothetical protein